MLLLANADLPTGSPQGFHVSITGLADLRFYLTDRVELATRHCGVRRLGMLHFVVAAYRREDAVYFADSSQQGAHSHQPERLERRHSLGRSEAKP